MTTPSSRTAGSAHDGESPRPLDAVVVTHELSSRTSRAPDHGAECRLLRTLARSLSAAPEETLEALAREALAITRPDSLASVGISLLDHDAGTPVFRWATVAGPLAARAGTTIPRETGMCALCLEADAPILLRRPELTFHYLRESGLPFVETLLVPMRVMDEWAGVVWMTTHDDAVPIDAEDARILGSVADATAAACAALRARDDAAQEHRRLAESEASFRAVQDASPDGKLLCRAVRDAEGRISDFEITYANDAAVRLLHAGGTLQGSSLRAAFPRAASRGRVEVYARVVESGEPLLEETFFEEQGEMHGLRVTAVPVADGLHITFADLTQRLRDAAERERLLEEARHAKQAAEQANRAKGEFLAAMSHELRTPLNAIAGYVELLDMGLRGPVSAEQRDALARIQQNQRHLLRLVNDVLNFSRLEAGRVEYRIEPVRLADVVSEVGPMVEPQIAAKGLAYAVEVSDDRVVMADREKLKQVLVNLLSNAAKFTPPGGRVRVSCPQRTDGTHPSGIAFLAVRDTGIGIPIEKLEDVFAPFVQVDTSASRRAAGAGLGLAISRDLARGMGGDLRARSVEGKGSTFTVALKEA